MSNRWQDRFNPETFARMAEDIEHAVQVASDLQLEPLALRRRLRAAAFYLRLALEMWPK